MAWNGRKSAVTIAEENLDSWLESVGIGAGMTVGQSKEFGEAVKAWVNARIEVEKDDLRDQINNSGMWDPDY
jgi:hypothetical protein